MSHKSKIVASAVLSALFAAVSAVNAATSITLNLEYMGSTTGNANTATKIAQNTGNGVALTTASGGNLTTIKNGLTKLDLTDPSIQSTANLKNYFAVYVDYVPDNPATDRLYGVGFSVMFPTGMAPVLGNNNSDTTTNKFFNWNPIDSNSTVATWDTLVNSGDLKDIGIFQATADSAYAMNIGTPDAIGYDDAGYISGKGTLLGVFALKFTSTNVVGSVTVAGTHGNACWYYEQIDTSEANSDSAFHYNSPIAVGNVPEPASLGVLALGGLALLARRRK